jgi:Sulfotransferase domain
MTARFFSSSKENTMGKLPDFIIAGIEKSGTTSLFANLSKHPRIEMTPNAFKYMTSGMMDNMKEPHFFNKRWDKGVKWYKGLFNDNDKLQGEAASNYLFKEEYIKRMASVVPNAKMIIALRDPVTRAYSQYNSFRGPFRRSLSAKLTRLEGDKNLLIRMAKLRDLGFDEVIKKEIDKGITLEGGIIIGKGLYIDLIENLLKYYPRKQVCIVISEQMKQDMQGTYNKIFDFLGVKRTKINFDMNVHAGKYEKPMSSWARETLNQIYGPYNERLFDFLGHQVPEWDTENERALLYSQ